MKQIDFTLDAFGPDGLLKEGYEVRHAAFNKKATFVKLFTDCIVFVYDDGGTLTLHKGRSGYDFSISKAILYRRTRTAEDVAKDWSNSQEGSDIWDNLPKSIRGWRTSLVQAGMDEMTKC